MSDAAAPPTPSSRAQADPTARLFGWLVLCVGYVVARPDHAAEAGIVLAGTAVWLMAHQIFHPRLRRGHPLRATLWLYLLTVGLALLCVSGGAQGWALPWARVLFRTAGCATLSVGLARGLTSAELLATLGSLPMPAPLRRSLEWTLRSVPLLVDETEDIARAVMIRSGRAGPGAAFTLAHALPRVWIPRVLGRADRLASAMLVRSYQGEALAPPRSVGETGSPERLLAVAATVFAAATILVRWFSP